MGKQPRLALFAVLLCLLVFSACSSNNTPSFGPDSTAAEPHTTSSSSPSSSSSSQPDGTTTAAPDVSRDVVRLLEAEPIDLASFAVGLDSCEQLDVALLSEMLTQELVNETFTALKDNEPSSDSRTCVLYALDDPEIELIRITADADTNRWSNLVVFNKTLAVIDGPLGDALGSPLDQVTAGGDLYGFSTMRLEQDNHSLVVEARTQISGVDYAPADVGQLAFIAQLASQQLASGEPGSGSTAISTCADLAPSSFSPFVDGDLGAFTPSSFMGSLTCTATSAQGSVVQILIAEFEDPQAALDRAGVVADAYQRTFREPREAEIDADIAWVVDRLFDDDPDATSQSTLYQGIGAKDGVFARIGLRVNTSVSRLPDTEVARLLQSVLDGENPREAFSLPDRTETLIAPVAEFTETGARVQVAPLSRGLTRCDELDLEPSEAITGVDLEAVTIADEVSDLFVECSLVHAGNDEAPTEIRVAAARSVDSVDDWTTDVDVNELTQIDGIGDTAYWNEGSDGVLVLYVIEGDAAMYVEVTKHEWTPDVDLFWNAQQLATKLLKPIG